MSNTRPLPTPCEFAREVALSWLRVGYEALGLLSYIVKQDGPLPVSDGEEVNYYDLP